MTIDEILQPIHHSRGHFLRHLTDLPESAWDWKPYAECKSIRETLVHLIVDDLAALDAMTRHDHPDYEKISQEEIARDDSSIPELLNRLQAARDLLVSEIRARYAEADQSAAFNAWGTRLPLWSGVPFLASEDYYHAGQVAYIRMAVEPEWNYYGAIYG